MQTLTERLSGGGGPRRRIVAALGAIVVVVIAIAIVVGAGAPGASKGQSSGSTASGATTVQRRDLVETDTESGTLGYANQQTVFNRLSGTITYLPNVGAVVKTGGMLYQVDGYPVILFNGSYPAFRDLTSGDTNGPDIEELNADLKTMGFDPDNAITVDQTWQAATTDAVERFQGSIGQTETGTLTLGQIVFLPGSQLINAVDTTVGSTGGSAGSGSSSSDASGASDTTDPTSTATPTSYPIAGQAHAEFVDMATSSTPTPAIANAACPNDPTTTTTAITTTTPATDCPSIPSAPPTTTTTPATTTPTTTTTPSTAPSTSGTTGTALQAIVKLLETQNKLLLAELKSAKKSATTAAGSATGTGTGTSSVRGGGGGGSVSSGTASAGSSSSGSGSSSSGSSSSSAGASADPILSTSSTELVVTVDLDATKQSEAKLNEPVTVELPDGTTVNGKITGVSPVAVSSSSSSSSSSAGAGASAPSATIPVTVSLEKHADASALDQAAVSVNFEEQVANGVLSVPVTALLATQGGGYAVQEANQPHKLISVTPGLFAAGYVQISGPGVQDGMQVTDSQG